MHYELAELDSFVNQTLHPYSVQKFPAKAQIREWISFVEAQVLAIRTKMIDEVINNRDSKQNENYVQTHQKGIISLVDTIQGYYNFVFDQGNRLLLFVYKRVCGLLDNLLTFILKLLDNYLNVNLPIPDGYAIFTRRELTGQWLSLQEEFNRLPDLDKTLLTIALKPLHDFMEDTGPRITYQRLIYLQDLFGQLNTLLEPDNDTANLNYQYLSINRELQKLDLVEASINVKFHMLLFYLNHNSPEYVNYCISALQRKVDTKPDTHGRVLVLRLYAKILRVTRGKHGSALQPDERRVNRQLSDWITGELEFIQSESINSHPYGDMEEPEANPVGKQASPKLNTNFDVRELAFIARIFKENNRLPDHNTTIMRFMAEHFTTTGSDELSYRSLYNKWFTPRTSTVLTVRDFFLDCLKSIRKWV